MMVMSLTSATTDDRRRRVLSAYSLAECHRFGLENECKESTDTVPMFPIVHPLWSVSSSHDPHSPSPRLVTWRNKWPKRGAKNSTYWATDEGFPGRFTMMTRLQHTTKTCTNNKREHKCGSAVSVTVFESHVRCVVMQIQDTHVLLQQPIPRERTRKYR